MTHRPSQRNRAVVLGASISGLLAARVLADHFDQVTVVERDALPDGAAARKGVAQGRHLHGFLAGGVNAMAELFPGFVAGARARGAEYVDVGRLGDWYVTGVPLRSFDSGLHGLLLSRLALEAYVRELVQARANVSILTQRRAIGLCGDATRVHGVRLLKADGQEEELLRADLLIDASGRGSRSCEWLQELGVAAPPEERVRADLTVTSCTIRRRPEHLQGAPAFIYSPTPPALMSGAALAIEDERYVIAITTYLNARAPKTFAEMIACARALPVRGLDRLLESAELLSEPVQFHDRESRRRRYEALDRFPLGVLIVGDALCSFNPSYGQGMTVAAKQALLLDAWLGGRMPNGPRAFFRAAATLIDVPWSTIVAGDLQWRGVQGERSLRSALLARLFRRLVRASARDAEIARTLLSVTHLVAPPATLFSPRVLLQALRHGGPLPGEAARASESAALHAAWSSRPDSGHWHHSPGAGPS
jgi:2-polyprenyl-6-methoxyphenol hydroxylase-like FAD-dependent oxidoreductase